MVQLSQLYVIAGKTTAVTIRTFVGRAMSLLFSTLPRFVITFPPRSNRLPISWLQWPSTVSLEPRRGNLSLLPLPIFICHEAMGLDATILVLLFFLIFSFKLALSLSSSTLTKRLFRSSSLYVIRAVSSAYLRLLMFLPPILIPACNSEYGLNRVTTDNAVLHLSQS